MAIYGEKENDTQQLLDETNVDRDQMVLSHSRMNRVKSSRNFLRAIIIIMSIIILKIYSSKQICPVFPLVEFTCVFGSSVASDCPVF